MSTERSFVTKREYIQWFREERNKIALSKLNQDDFRDSLRVIAEDINSSSTHFIFELIQNAEDNAYEPTIKPTLQFSVIPAEPAGKCCPRLVVQNNEFGFQQEECEPTENRHVAGVCRINKTTKKKRLGYVGEKGIGFKSVFKVTHDPAIHSNGYHFHLPDSERDELGLGYVVPYWTDEVPSFVSSNGTTLILPLDKTPKAVGEVLGMLGDLRPETILFLRKLRRIEISATNLSRWIERIEPRDSARPTAPPRLVTLGASDDGRELAGQDFWLCSEEAPKPPDLTAPKEREGIDSREVTVALPLTETPHRGDLYAYLPVYENTGLPFLINADFLLTSDREKLDCCDWNNWLIGEVAAAYVSALLSCLLAEDVPLGKRICAYSSVPLECHRDCLVGVKDQIVEELKETPCVLTQAGTLQYPWKCRFVDKEWRALLADAVDTPPALLRRVVHEDVDRLFRKQLGVTHGIGVRELSGDDIRKCLRNTAWLERQSDEWQLRLYELLAKRKDLGNLTGIPLVPVRRWGMEVRRLSCDDRLPAYFEIKEKEWSVLSVVPGWLREFSPVATLSESLWDALARQNADRQKSLMDWMTSSLRIYPFSIENYCVDVASKVERNDSELSDEHLLEVTQLLTDHAAPNLDWTEYPLLAADGRRYSLAGLKRLERTLVVPEDCEPATGWQRIWVAPADREHFVALDKRYLGMKAKLFEKVKPKPYPPLQSIRLCSEAECSTQGLRNLFAQAKTTCAASRRSDVSLDSWIAPRLPAVVSEELGSALLTWLGIVGGTRDLTTDSSLHEIGLRDRARYENYGTRHLYQPSELHRWLKETSWVPTTQGIQRPSDTFVDRPETRELLDDDAVAYVKGSVPLPLAKALGIHLSAGIDDILGVLESRASGNEDCKTSATRIYMQLASRAQPTLSRDYTRDFDAKRLILTHQADGSVRWRTRGECVWADAGEVFGDEYGYLKQEYPADLQVFFVERLRVNLDVDDACYVNAWISLQKCPWPLSQNKLRLVERLYAKMKDVVAGIANPEPDWFVRFRTSAKAFTRAGALEDRGTVFFADDKDYEKAFGDSISYAWLPKDAALADWMPLLDVLGVERLSRAVVSHLLESRCGTQPLGPEILSSFTLESIASWIWNSVEVTERESVLDRLYCLVECEKCRCEQCVRVELILGEERAEVQWPVLWHLEERCLYVCQSEEEGWKAELARQLARYLHPTLDDRLALWIEAVLGTKSMQRVEKKGWTLPDDVRTRCHVKPELEASDTESEAGDSPSPSDTGNQMPQSDSATHSRPSIPSAGPPPAPPARPATTPRLPAPAPSNSAQGASQPPQPSRKTLAETLRRPGERCVDEAYEPVPGSGAMNPERRGQKIGERLNDAIADEPSPDERRRQVERSLLEPPPPEIKSKLLRWYGGRCQVAGCDRRFAEDDGKPFFCATYFLPLKEARFGATVGNAICLCADHFAQWQCAHRLPTDGLDRRVLRAERPVDGQRASILFGELCCDTDVVIEYHPVHLQELQVFVRKVFPSGLPLRDVDE